MNFEFFYFKILFNYLSFSMSEEDLEEINTNKNEIKVEDIKNKKNNKTEKEKLKIEDSKFNKEIFIRNLNFNTTEEKLKDFFTQYIPEDSIEFCLIVKDKETQNSKGTAFIKLTGKSYNKLMNLYYESNKRKYSSLNEMNPFELEGRNLKLFDAISKDEIKNLEKEKDKKQSKRSKEFLYYGLSKESINYCDLIEEINDLDIQRREKLIQIKKDNYYKNPNFHVSLTRLSLRNFEKNINENDIKKIIYDTINGNKEITKKYKNIKMIKQIKLLRDENEKSKCVAFVECVDFDLGKFLIDKLSGFKFNNKSNKGLILDFSLDDLRKKNVREKKIERIKVLKKQKQKEKKKQLNLINNKDKNEKKITLNDCNNIDKLIELYQKSFSRGKKQRIKKKLKSLGYNKNIPPLEIINDNIKEENIEINEKDDYEQIKIENNKTNLNKKLKDKIKKEKKENKNIGKKRNRESSKSKFNFDDEERKNKKLIKKEKKEIKIAKKEINERRYNKNKLKEDFSDEIDDIQMKDYYDKIMKKLNKNKKKENK